ncbi:hypothetical protein ACHAXS_013147 [Conticribra weissflogii]
MAQMIYCVFQSSQSLLSVCGEFVHDCIVSLWWTWVVNPSRSNSAVV